MKSSHTNNLALTWCLLLLWTKVVSVSVQTQWMIPFKLWVVDAFFFEKQDEEEKLFTRRLFSNFDRTTMLLSPSFKAIVELYRFFTVSYCGRTPFFRNGMERKLLSARKVLCFCLRWFKLLLCFSRSECDEISKFSLFSFAFTLANVW